TDRLGDLMSFSLVEYEEISQRYRLHDLARVWARHQMNDLELSSALQRHAQYYCFVLGIADELYLKGDGFVAAGLALFDRETENINAGQSWASANFEKHPMTALLCSNYSSTGNYVKSLRFHPNKLINWAKSALVATQTIDTKHPQAIHLGSLGNAYMSMGQA